MMSTVGASIGYAGRPVLRDVTLSVDDGQLVYLLGRNGAGKSTLLRAMCAMVRPSSGKVLVDGVAPWKHARPAAAVGVHLGADAAGSPAGPHPSHTGRRHLRWLAAASGTDPARVDRVLVRVGLAADADRRITDYSLGMRQRLGIAASLLSDAPNLIFDEPVNGLDIDGIRWLRRLLRGLADDGRAVIIASHLFDEVSRTADRVVVLDRGRVRADAALTDFVADHDDLEAAYLDLVRTEAR